MALARSYNNSSKIYLSISRVLFHSTQTTTPNQFHINEDSLYRRISPVGDPNVSIIPIIEQWRNERKSITFDQLVFLIKALRKFNRFNHALQVSEWMSSRMSKVRPGGIAVHLDLVSQAKGLEQAEMYFDSLPDNVKKVQVYSTLLNCYARAKSVEKAEAIAAKMKEMRMMTTLCYNSMLYLYMKVGDIKKLESIYQEMVLMGVLCSRRTFYIRLSAYAYASASNLEKMEKVLKVIEEDLSLKVDWDVYILAFRGYRNSGLPDKAFDMLKKLEEHIHVNSERLPWEILLSAYASIGKKDEVYRVWKKYKSLHKKVYNRGYSRMINALVILDDIDGAEKLLALWESETLYFDFKVPNFLINAYCKNGLIGKAEAYVYRVICMGKQPSACTWVIMAAAYKTTNEMKKAVESLKRSMIAKDKRGWKLDQDTLNACVEYLKENGDSKMAEEVEITFKDRVCVERMSGEEHLDDENEDSLNDDEMR